MLSNKMFDTLKYIAQFLLPGLATLYFALSGIWNFPNTTEVVGTLVALSVFLGAILGISTMQYKESKLIESRIMSGYSTPAPEVERETPASLFAIPSDVYDILKWVTLILMPALGTLYFAISQLWGLPYGEQVVGTIAALTSLFGLLLGISTLQYKKEISNTENDQLIR